jgi:hypothetical protein
LSASTTGNSDCCASGDCSNPETFATNNSDKTVEARAVVVATACNGYCARSIGCIPRPTCKKQSSCVTAGVTITRLDYDITSDIAAAARGIPGSNRDVTTSRRRAGPAHTS